MNQHPYNHSKCWRSTCRQWLQTSHSFMMSTWPCNLLSSFCICWFLKEEWFRINKEGGGNHAEKYQNKYAMNKEGGKTRGSSVMHRHMPHRFVYGIISTFAPYPWSTRQNTWLRVSLALSFEVENAKCLNLPLYANVNPSEHVSNLSGLDLCQTDWLVQCYFRW